MTNKKLIVQPKRHDYCVFYDAGHGAKEPGTEEYTTAPNKLFDFKDYVGRQYAKFHQGSIFLEGVKNRIVAELVINELEKQNINVIRVYHPWKDTSLKHRVALADYYHNNIQKGMYVSEHSNAHNTKARGFSIWTSKGRTKSDFLADKFHQMYAEEFRDIPQIKVRSDKSDGDHDYEANFYVLRETDMPSVLFENLFFDNYEDAMLLIDINYITRYAKLQAKWIIWCLNYLYND
jgi:N-acetylmuramoyl-L-alanine amidase